MFEPESRYFDLPRAELTLADGRLVRYVRRRLLPPANTSEVRAEHTVVQGERLDHIAARHLGDAELFWQLCDINNAMRPDDLTREVGRTLHVSLLLV